MHVLIAVTHLLGTGHLRRALALAHAFVAAGHRVTLASGGTPVSGLDTAPVHFVQLPPLTSDGTNFTTLLTADGTRANEPYLEHRQDALLSCLQDPPDAIITELFPFGRRVLTAEFTALLDRAHALKVRPKVLSSIRDILAPPSKPSKAARTDAVIAQYYDAVLVHSDETTTALDASWPVSDALREKLHYTGFVAPDPPAPLPGKEGAGEILVSTGGGAVGATVFETALAAAALTPDLTWRLLIGGVDPAALISRLKAKAPDNAKIEAARPDFRQMLNHAMGSVSLAGYNTVMDVLQTRVPGLLIPFDDGGEVEQTLRARSLSALPGFAVLRSADLTPDHMANAVRSLIKSGRRAPSHVAMDGAATSVRVTEKLVQQP